MDKKRSYGSNLSYNTNSRSRIKKEVEQVKNKDDMTKKLKDHDQTNRDLMGSLYDSKEPVQKDQKEDSFLKKGNFKIDSS